MTRDRLIEILSQVQKGELQVDRALEALKVFPFEDLGFARIDHHRSVRKGFPEVIFGQGKTPHQVASIGEALLRQSDRLLVTRASEDAFSALQEKAQDAEFDDVARTIVWTAVKWPRSRLRRAF